MEHDKTFTCVLANDQVLFVNLLWWGEGGGEWGKFNIFSHKFPFGIGKESMMNSINMDTNWMLLWSTWMSQSSLILELEYRLSALHSLCIVFKDIGLMLTGWAYCLWKRVPAVSRHLKRGTISLLKMYRFFNQWGHCPCTPWRARY